MTLARVESTKAEEAFAHIRGGIHRIPLKSALTQETNFPTLTSSDL